MAVALAGCGASVGAAAKRAAARDLTCDLPGRRVMAIGRLVADPRAPFEVALFEASGCEQEQLYVCIDTPTPRCERQIAALPRPETHAALTRSLHLLRTASRARCPPADLTVVQESESLFHFDACDGEWLYHCIGSRCEKL